jgi:hypothetical protein
MKNESYVDATGKTLYCSKSETSEDFYYDRMMLDAGHGRVVAKNNSGRVVEYYRPLALLLEAGRKQYRWSDELGQSFNHELPYFRERTDDSK